MSFVSFAFIALYAIVLLARLTLGRNKTESAYLGVLLVSSLLFYGWHTPSYLLLIGLSTSVDYVCGLLLHRGGTSAMRKAVLALSIVVNLGLLVWFKYANFFAGLVASAMLGTEGGGSITLVSAELPVGISFYTFQSMSYTIDVYYGRMAPQRSFARFLLFVSFFPQLVAGPIVRARDFFRQLPRQRRMRMNAMLEGGYLIVRGFFLKMAVADNLSYFVDEHWAVAATKGSSGSFALWVAFLFSCQIFADFAGYSSIARGLGLTLGFRLPVNFRAPYIAATFSEFWRRWHVTLSSWLRDYLYLPLGGNRCGQTRTYVNLFLVMLLGGLWHGAAMTFVLWGVLHGGFLALERLLGLNAVDRTRSASIRFGWYVFVQLGVLAAWVFFRSESAGEAVVFLGNVVALGSIPWQLIGESAAFVLPILALHFRTTLAERRGVRVSPFEKTVVAGVMACVTLIVYGDQRGFIYFQF